MSEKKGFILPYGTAKQIGRLIAISGPEAAVQFMEALEQYSLDGTEPEGLDMAAEMLFEGMRKELDIDREKYDKAIKQRKDAADARWNKEKETEQMRNDATACNRMRVDADSRQKTEDRRQEIEVKDSIAGAEPLIGLPLNDGSEHEVTEEDVAEYAQLYPAVDVMQQLRNMRGWLMANPSRRKTKRGIKAFIASWLAKEQDHPRARSGTHKLTADEILAIPAINPWSEEVST